MIFNINAMYYYYTNSGNKSIFSNAPFFATATFVHSLNEPYVKKSQARG